MKAVKIVPWVAVILVGSAAICLARKRVTQIAGNRAAALAVISMAGLAGELMARR